MGHAIWTTLAGITLGLALSLWNRAKWASPLAAAGIAFSALDHLANNYSVSDERSFASYPQGLLALTFAFFLAGVVIVILFDLFAIHAQLPKLPELKLPNLQSGVDGLKRQWAFLVERRAFAYVLFRQRGTSNLARANLVCLGTVLDQSSCSLTPESGFGSMPPMRDRPVSCASRKPTARIITTLPGTWSAHPRFRMHPSALEIHWPWNTPSPCRRICTQDGCKTTLVFLENFFLDELRRKVAAKKASVTTSLMVGLPRRQFIRNGVVWIGPGLVGHPERRNPSQMAARRGFLSQDMLENCPHVR